MEKNKEWFISQYIEIHQNLNDLEKEIENYLSNKELLLENGQLLEDLSKRVKNEIKRLKKTRKYEQKIFNY